MKIENVEKIIKLNNKHEATKEIKGILKLAVTENTNMEIKLKGEYFNYTLNYEDLRLIDSKSEQETFLSKLLELSEAKIEEIEKEIKEI
ncbi:Uncharacterised protein [Sebaldella termitidis]|uniref:Uncharacterized protein n=1 Tax=Sebaldella termitidis (strain ATCC 33386 / NCTC 11300) TaxID=526218 RepID=D1AQY4_SEBTE|nr:hypothetical protein [Sebaldella termitidis]ACZ07672.1 hypothetical protein Sterm_0800 [Sebaldella termitidis ATCC 33386]SUI22968.1 Uncharacterised protein [Sebaldella termitidis]